MLLERILVGVYLAACIGIGIGASKRVLGLPATSIGLRGGASAPS